MRISRISRLVAGKFPGNWEQIGEEMKIKEKLKQFGILVIRLIWPGRANKGAQRLGIMILGLGLMIGVSQAGPIQKLVSGALFGETKTVSNTDSKVAVMTNNNVVNDQTTGVSAVDVDTNQATIGAPNIVDLIGDSELIVRGMVKELTDGFENGVPYTQVTVQVSEALRGQFGKEYTYRQFGLLKPKSMGNGKVNVNVTPDGWAKYKQGEDVVLFLYKQASITGLRTTTGLGQGKISVKGGNVESQFGNVGLFEKVEVDQKMLNDRDKRLMATKKGVVNTESFMSFVRKAVKDKWVEGGKLRHAKK